MDKLESHLKSHSAERPVKCGEGCDKTYKDQAGLAAHRRTTHNRQKKDHTNIFLIIFFK